MSKKATDLQQRRLDETRDAIDRLADIRRQIADLEDKEAKIVGALDKSGLEAVEGTIFNAAIIRVAEALLPDWKKIALKCKPSKQLINANRKKRKAYVQVRLTARS